MGPWRCQAGLKPRAPSEQPAKRPARSFATSALVILYTSVVSHRVPITWARVPLANSPPRAPRPNTQTLTVAKVFLVSLASVQALREIGALAHRVHRSSQLPVSELM